MIYAICGLIIGAVMGLTGAGGALVAIPLFMQFLNTPLKDATVFSLVAVVIASLLNFIAQRKNTNYKIAYQISFFSFWGSLVSTQLKPLTPEIILKLLLVLVALYGTYSIWKTQKNSPVENHSLSHSWKLSSIVGFFLGALTTFTGLGGGVLMMPVFLNFYSFSQEQAIATSLFAISISSLVSLFIQVQNGFRIPIDLSLVYLLSGILLSAFVLKFLMNKLPKNKMDLVRKIVFTSIVLLAILKIF
jgi:uncharacterized membrane protein YfcA